MDFVQFRHGRKGENAAVAVPASDLDLALRRIKYPNPNSAKVSYRQYQLHPIM